MKLSGRVALGSVVAFACLALVGSTAHAQVRPHVLIIFDTSKSMLQTNRDGTPLCMGAGAESRIFRLKQAMRDALVTVGSDEANFGLMRFPQKELPTVKPNCPNGHYLPESCVISTHEGESSYGAWFDAGYRESLVVDVTRRPTAGPIAQVADFDPADGNIPEVYKWIDLTEDTDQVAPIDDPELRAGSDTPLGRSLFYARLYFENFVFPNDPLKACRKNIVVLVTDGEESCDNEPGTINLADCSGTLSAFSPRRAACDLLRGLGIKTYVITDVGTGAQNDLVAEAGGSGKAVEVSLQDSSAARAALTGIIAEAVPAGETCNGADDNCNGATDEGVSNQCPFDPAGLKHCAVEACNCRDDDCDGEIDDGFPLASCGIPCGCASPTERCDGVDNNCDGMTDEGFSLGGACDNGLLGACKREGVFVCADDGAVGCSAPPIPQSPELCNGIDDDCDGMTDEDTPMPGEGASCGVPVGECEAGTTKCEGGTLVCMGTGMSMPETCDGLDNDCNGLIDDGVLPGVDAACVCDDQDPAKAGVGACHKGHTICLGTAGLTCIDCGKPGDEFCDGIDNDCDGQVDAPDLKPCPAGFACREGGCATMCMPGEFPCPAGCECRNDYCICDKCFGVHCEAGLTCDKGVCKDLCKNVACDAPMTCKAGRCVDCYEADCPSGQWCLNGTCEACPGGVCDPCASVTCGANDYCDSGQCVPRCRKESCEQGYSCAGATCRQDKCAAVACLSSQFCDPADGVCKANPCLVKQCKKNLVCVPTVGDCRPDPCARVDCNDECRKCQITADGVPTCVPSCRIETQRPYPGGGGGCGGCAVPATSPSPGVSVIAVLALGAWRRRRSGSGRL